MKISIKFKLIRMQLVLASALLLACTMAFVLNDLFIFKRAAERNLNSLAKILSENLTPTLVFSDQKEAEKILSALQLEPSISYAVLLDANGNLFAQYGHHERPVENFLREIQNKEGVSLEGDHINLSHRIMQNNELKGSLFFHAELRVFATEYKGYIWVLSSVILAGLLMAFALALWTQHSLSHPIASLAVTAKAVSVSGNYSFRASPEVLDDPTEEIATLSHQFNAMLNRIESQDEKIRAANAELENKVQLRTQELKEIQKTALQNAHAAGMAEIATGILHNIGNIINSINTSIDEIHEITQKSKIASLIKANEMLQANQSRVAEFLSTDPKGQLLPEFYIKIGSSIQAEHEKLENEAKSLVKKVNLIKDVIQTQQEYAKKDLFFEEVALDQITDEILNLQMNSLIRHGVGVTKNYHATSPVRLQRVKFAHILMNLVKNAKEAMSQQERNAKFLTIEINQDLEKGTYLKIMDSGEGISHDNLEKIFSHGFTTKQSGHGFGLHFCANAMTEMGGKLVVESKGLGQGASFTLYFAKLAKEVKYA